MESSVDCGVVVCLCVGEFIMTTMIILNAIINECRSELILHL